MDASYDVFVSHNGLDKPVAERLCWALLEAGVRPWFDKWDLAPGDVWIREVERVLDRVPAVIVCVGEHGLSAWLDLEQQATLGRGTGPETSTVVPVLLPGAAADVELSVFLRTRQAVDLRQEPAWTEGVARLVATLTGKTESRGPWIDEGRERPYRGLQPFTEADAGWMFGREQEEQKLLDTLRHGQRFVAVVGASGSGKSSLVRAGVVPAVRTGAFDGRQRWHALVMRPGARPCSALAMKLVELRRTVEGTAADLATDGREVDELRERIMGSPNALADMADLLLTRNEHDDQLLVVVDQFEELFTAPSEPPAATSPAAADPLLAAGTKLAPEGAALLRNLLSATSDHDGRVRVMLTVRADFIGECLVVPEFARRMERMSIALAPMEAPQLREAVRRPALRVGYDVEAALVDALVSATAGVAGRLPLFQHTLDLLWDARDRRARRLAYAAYVDQVGSIEDSVARRAESVFGSLVSAKAEHEAVVRRVFLRLVHLGEGTGDTRVQVPRSDLPDDPAVGTVLDAFVGARLLTTDTYRASGSTQPEQSVEIVNEALIARWGRLRRWLNENRDALRIRQEVDGAAAEWQRRGRPDDELWRGARLARARETLAEGDIDFSAEERAFIDAGQAAEDAARLAVIRRQRWILGGVSGAAAVLGVSLVVAIVLARENATLANKEREQADAAKKSAEEAKQLAARESAARAEADAARVEAVRLAREEQGARASLLAAIPGRELEALELGVLAVGKVTEWGLPSAHVTSDLYDALARVRRVVVLAGHESPITASAWSPDGTRMATASNDRTARLWDARTGKQVATLGSEPIAATSIAWSGSLVATAGWDGVTRLWDGDTGEAVRSLDGHGPGHTVLAWQHDGNRIATGGTDETVKLWDPATGERLQTLEGHQEPVTALAWSSRGRRLASGSMTGGLVLLWDPETNTEVATLTGKMPWLTTMAWSYEGSILATAASVTTLWNGETGTEMAELSDPVGAMVVSLAWAPKYPLRLATASADGKAKLWDVTTKAETATLTAPSASTMVAAWSPKDGLLATAGVDRTVRVWSTQTGELVLVLQEHSDQITALEWAPDGTRVASASADATVRLWDLERGDTRSILREADGLGVNRVEWTPDGARVAGIASGTLDLWDPETGGSVLERLAPFPGLDVAFVRTSDDLRVASVRANGELVVWDEKGKSRATFTWPDRISAASFSPDGSHLAAGSDQGSGMLWNVGTGTVIADLTGHTRVVAAHAWTHDGSRLATASYDATIRLWDGRTGAAQRTLSGHSAAVGAVAWSPDGTRLVTGSDDGTARIWDASSGETLGTLVHGVEAVAIVAVAWQPNGTLVATADNRGTVKLWDGSSTEASATLVGHLTVIEELAWSPNGTRLATADRSGVVRLWDGTGAPLAVFRGHTDFATAMAWSPDGTWLATANADATVRVWPGSDRGSVLRACDVLESSTGAIALQPKSREICAEVRE